VTVSIKSKAGIKLESEAFITLSAPLVNIEANGPCAISGLPVKIN